MQPGPAEVAALRFYLLGSLPPEACSGRREGSLDRKRLIWSLIILGFAVMAIAGPVKMARQSAAAEQDDTSVEGNRVSMAGLTFRPDELVVPRGTEVTFDNDDAAPHTVTVRNNGIDSGIVNPGSAFKLVINEPFEYQCNIHPAMQARVVLRG